MDGVRFAVKYGFVGIETRGSQALAASPNFLALV
jgi:hypothetical protein